MHKYIDVDADISRYIHINCRPLRATTKQWKTINI